MKNHIDTALCNGCGNCRKVCPTGQIALTDEPKARFIPEVAHNCQECGQCMAICSKQAIRVNGLSYELHTSELPSNPASYEELMDLLLQRRSVRRFKATPLPEELIEKISDAIQLAPYGTAAEEMHMTVINSRENIESALPIVRDFLKKLVKGVENPVARHFIRRAEGKESFNTIRNHLYPLIKAGNYHQEGKDHISWGAPALIIFHASKGAEAHTENGIIYGTYAMLAAQSLGLGSCISGIIPPVINKVKELKEMFGIPKDHEAVMGLLIGYPKGKYLRSIHRDFTHVNIHNN